MAMSSSAIVAILVTAIVGHGVLRPLLEARGVRPWSLKDSIGALMLVMIGGAGFAAGLTALIVCRVYHSDFVLFDVLCLALLCCGALTMRLGLLALRKLT